ncbi:MAG TPA: ABC transporter permease [Silvibacterium sp.]|nr:ABC transporter permease [Silvibacterium sp.]
MRWRKFFRRGRSDADLSTEIEQHLAQEFDDNRARGLSSEEARREAMMKFGSVRRVREDLWQQNTLAFLDNVWRDLRYAARALARSPGFTIIAVLVMALGIGANTALFTVVRSVLLKPLPYNDPNRLVAPCECWKDRVCDSTGGGNAGGSFAEWRKASKSFEQMALSQQWTSYNISAEGGQLPERVPAGLVSWNMFSTLGVHPVLGRDFTAEDDRQGANATVILSWRFWKRRFGGDPSVLGKDVFLDAKPYTVIGVMPAWFAYPHAQTQVWTPLYHEMPPRVTQSLENHQFDVVARLNPGAAMAQALSELDAVQKQIKQDNPGPAVKAGVSGRLLLDNMVLDYKTPLYTLLAATGCVLLIACLNVANLLVARSAARRRETAIRAALGGNRWRLIREQLTESLLLASAGGAGGLALAYAGIAWLRVARDDLARADTIHIDGLVVLFVAGITLASGVLAGLIPAFGGGVRMLETLQESSRSHSAGQSRTRLRKGLLAAEVSLTVILLFSAGLLLKSYQKLRTTDIGCAIDNVLTMQLRLPEARYKEPVQKAAFFEQLIARVRALPGVKAAGLVTVAPGDGWGGDDLVSVVEHPPLPPGKSLDAMERAADPGYFAAMQIPLLHGRTFNESERLNHANVVILNQAAVRRFFPDGEDPLGKHLRFDMSGGPQQAFEIIGVVGDTRYDVSEEMRPKMYWPLWGGVNSGVTILVRSAHDVESLALPVQKVVSGLDRDLPVSDVMTMRQMIGKTTVDASFDSTLILAFAVIALVLAAVGLYGVLSYLATQRRSEIGIRIALGAQRGAVMRMMLADGLAPAWIGLVLGLLGSGFAVRLIRDMLYGVQPLDWSVFIAVALMLSVVAAAACAVPAWRASRLDPMQALRTE